MTMDVQTSPALDQPAWRLAWLTPLRCRILLGLLLVSGAVFNLLYLHINCPIDLSGDEAQYWDWSRRLDWNYYSKGPLVAYIIRASCAIFGDTMQAVRYPAILLSVMTSIATYLLVLRLFRSDRLALGTVLLFGIMPIFIVGSIFMSIDPPMFFCWALATYLAAIAIFDQRRWMWVAVGVVIGTGFLAKYMMPLWFVGLFGFLIVDRQWKALKHALLAPAIMLVFTLPPIIWNAKHDWVSLRHVAQQTGASQGMFDLGNVFEMIAGQLGVVGPTVGYIMACAVVWAILPRFSKTDPNRRRLIYLVWIGLPFLLMNVLVSFRAKVQPNWPAPAYFSLAILTAYFLGTRLQSLRTWKPWRGWFHGSVVIGLCAIPIVKDTSILIPIIRPIVPVIDRVRDKPFDIARVDALARLRGWEEEGQYISQQLTTLGPGAFVLCDHYQQTAEMAFYVSGRPKVYYAGSYSGNRLSQYDMWPDYRLDPTSPLVGQNAVYLGKSGGPPEQIVAAFERVDRQPHVESVIVHGVEVKTYKTWRCYGFRGMQAPEGIPQF